MNTSFLKTTLVLALLVGCRDEVKGSGDGDDPGEDCVVEPESCDGLDNNCNGEIDEGLLTRYYIDRDGDGYGDPEEIDEACEVPEGFVENRDDCNDLDAAFYPGAEETDCEDPNDYNCDGSVGSDDRDSDGVIACLDCNDLDASLNPEEPEVCDSVDNNCDGAVDVDAADALTWYLDADADGYGDPAASLVQCEQPAGYVNEGSDCDDLDPSALPGVAEACDLVDNDCDGDVDEDPAVSPAWYTDGDGDGYGGEIAGYGCPDAEGMGPEGTIAQGGDCDDADALYHPGAEESDCADANDYNCDGSVGFADLDGDGWAACEECDDAEGAVNPGEDEICDSVDNDCDAVVDLDAVDAETWHLDADGDGHGDPAVSLAQCEAPEQYVASSDDCDDLAAATWPGADETCDLADNDCDGSADEGAIDPTSWYTDEDGDGYGGALSSLACPDPDGMGPAGTIAVSGDCDDESADTHPGAPEICDEMDNDCDDELDEMAVDAITWYADADGDGYGVTGDTLESCEQPAGYALTGDDCDDALADTHPGAAEICSDGIDNDCLEDSPGCEVPLAGAASGVIYGESANEGGFSLGSADVNGDGVSDVLVGALSASNGGASVYDGAAYFFYGPLEASQSLASADATITGAALDQDAVGAAVGGVGDVDGDGTEDVAITGTQMENAAGDFAAGGVMVFSGASLSGSLTYADADVIYYGEDKQNYLGALAAADVDADGLGDLLIGASWGPDRDTKLGTVYLISGGEDSGEISAAKAAEASWTGESMDDKLGSLGSLAIPGDLDGDGELDLAMGASARTSDSGAVYLVLGPHSGSASVGDGSVRLDPEATGDLLGRTLSAAGDADNDGYDDLLVGAPWADGEEANTGVVYLIPGGGSLSGLHGTSIADAAAARIEGDLGDAEVGESLDGAGDVDGDGANDVVVGSTTVGADALGAAYLFYGPLSGAQTVAAADAVLWGNATDDSAGSALHILAGGEGVLIDVEEDDTGAENAGAVYWIASLGL